MSASIHDAPEASYETRILAQYDSGVFPVKQCGICKARPVHPESEQDLCAACECVWLADWISGQESLLADIDAGKDIWAHLPMYIRSQSREDTLAQLADERLALAEWQEKAARGKSTQTGDDRG